MRRRNFRQPSFVHLQTSVSDAVFRRIGCGPIITVGGVGGDFSHTGGNDNGICWWTTHISSILTNEFSRLLLLKFVAPWSVFESNLIPSSCRSCLTIVRTSAALLMDSKYFITFSRSPYLRKKTTHIKTATNNDTFKNFTPALLYFHAFRLVALTTWIFQVGYLNK